MSDGPVADLHVHTVVSDGELALDELPACARAAGLDAVAVTDHDRINPDLGAPVVERAGVTVVHGVELRVEADRERIDLLGYGVERTADLVAELDRLQRDRIERTRRIAARVEDRLGVALDVEFGPGVGRPHVARAVERSPAPLDYGDAFAELIGDDGPCYVPRDVPGVERGAALLDDACALVALAHPYRYDDPAAALAAARAAGLDGIERYYPYGRAVDQSAADAAIDDGNLLATGGSDAHDRRLGRAGLDREGWRAVADRLPGTRA
ncbi:MAG: PHP domain-containing protein [Haloferacaceae archaeon]